MDYTTAGPLFKVRKAWRYVQMYGLRRTLVKVRGQYHMKRVFEPVPGDLGQPVDRQVFGLIGCGNYAFSNIAYYLNRKYPGTIRACMDIDPNRAASLATKYGVPHHTTDPRRVIDDPAIRLVFIASNHATHADYAIQALEAGKAVYIEKPHAVSSDQLDRLCQAAKASDQPVFLGYNRPGSRFGKLIRQHLDQQSGPLVINWFVAGHEIDPDHWYFRPEEGGRVLGNLCHWTDFTLDLVGEKAFPVRIIPARHVQSDSNIAVTYVFGDGSVAAITFSAKGHTFEGVMERLAIHRGDCLLTMDDYRTMTVREVHKKRRYVNMFRDHGHAANIISAARTVLSGERQDKEAALSRLKLSGDLMLGTREALERDEIIELS